MCAGFVTLAAFAVAMVMATPLGIVAMIAGVGGLVTLVLASAGALRAQSMGTGGSGLAVAFLLAVAGVLAAIAIGLMQALV